MIRDGVFDDVDICMDWHPADKTEANVQHLLRLLILWLSLGNQLMHLLIHGMQGPQMMHLSYIHQELMHIENTSYHQ